RSSGAVNAQASTILGSADLILGGAGNDTLSGGAGSSTLAGGAGNNIFSFSSVVHGGVTTVTDFNSNDQVNLVGYGSDAGATALANAAVSGGNTTLTLADNTKITFLNTSVAQLTGHITST